ncbi:helix-turn-helix domain-containing protein [Raoultella terrigena]
MVHSIVILAVPGVQLLDVAGPLDAFAEVNRILRRQIYRSVVVSLDGETIHASSGVSLRANGSLADYSASGPMSFLIAGSPNMAERELSEHQRQAVAALCRLSCRYGSVCTGALLLAQTGLLNNRQVTTHWSVAGELSRRHPEIEVNADALYVADGPVRTAAGVTSGMDLALRFIEEDVGRETARDVAANLVMFFRRPGGQGHFTRKQQVSTTGRAALQDLQRWVLTNLDTTGTAAEMANHINLSVRHLNRVFQQEMGVSTGEWLEQARIARARELLSERLPIKSVAAMCGYSSSDVMRRAFVKVTGMSPAMYQKIYAAGK